MSDDDISERIIKVQGLTFALAASAGKERDLREAREHLKAAIIGAIQTERARCAGIVQAAREGDIDSDLRSIISRIERGAP